MEPLVTSSLSSDEKLGTPVDFDTLDKEINIRGGVTGWNMICTFCQPKWRTADYVAFVREVTHFEGFAEGNLP